jgi:hypothetical protein
MRPQHIEPVPHHLDHRGWPDTDDSDDEGESELGAGHVEQPARVPCRRQLVTISVTVGRSDDEAGNEIV